MDGKSTTRMPEVARKKLKYLYCIFIFNNKLQHHNVNTFLLLLTSFRKLDCRFVQNVDNLFYVSRFFFILVQENNNT